MIIRISNQKTTAQTQKRVANQPYILDGSETIVFYIFTVQGFFDTVHSMFK
jgi:hypothetical protein